MYRKGGFKLTAFFFANWGNNPDNGKSISSYIVFLSNASLGFKVGLQALGLTAQSTMDYGGRARGRSASDEGSGVLL